MDRRRPSSAIHGFDEMIGGLWEGRSTSRLEDLAVEVNVRSTGGPREVKLAAGRGHISLVWSSLDPLDPLDPGRQARDILAGERRGEIDERTCSIDAASLRHMR